MAVNIDGMFLMAQEVGANMIQNQVSGSIIQTSSIYGVVAPDQRVYAGSQQMNSPAVYSASKAAVIGLSKHLATYWASKNIRVNSLSPGGIENGQDLQFIDSYSNRVPMGRMAHARDMVGACVFLASNASSYVTGQNFIIDGGLTAW